LHGINIERNSWGCHLNIPENLVRKRYSPWRLNVEFNKAFPVMLTLLSLIDILSAE